jgi:Icc-related predicted phosphoesterase
MTRVMVLGDTHGDTPAATNVIRKAKKHGVKKIVVVGDFGLWDHFEEGVRFLDAINEYLRRDGIKLYAVGGNHENWLRWNWYVANNPATDEGFSMLRSHVYLVPRTLHWSWFGRTFAAAGGAVSIDRAWRLERERESGLGPNTLFWWDEQLLDSDVDAFEEKKVDYLFTHDCSNSTPFRDRLKPDMESQVHRQRIDEILKKSAPEMHFHGHMHTKYDWMNLQNTIVGPKYIQTYGLECNGMYWNWGVLDVDAETFEFTPAVSRQTDKIV